MSRMASCEPERMMTRSRSKRSEDDMLEVLNLYAPAGGRIEVVGSNGQVDLAGDKAYRGLQVVCGEAHVQIGAPAEITFNVTVSPEAAQELSVRIPPDGAGLPVGGRAKSGPASSLGSLNELTPISSPSLRGSIAIRCTADSRRG